MAKKPTNPKAPTSPKIPRELYTFAKDLALLVGYHCAQHVKRRDDIKAVLQNLVDNLDDYAGKAGTVTAIIREELGLPPKARGG